MGLYPNIPSIPSIPSPINKLFLYINSYENVIHLSTMISYWSSGQRAQTSLSRLWRVKALRWAQLTLRAAVSQPTKGRYITLMCVILNNMGTKHEANTTT